MPPRVDNAGNPLPPIVQAELDNNFVRHHARLLATWCDERQVIPGGQVVALVDVIDAIQRLLDRNAKSKRPGG